MRVSKAHRRRMRTNASVDNSWPFTPTASLLYLHRQASLLHCLPSDKVSRRLPTFFQVGHMLVTGSQDKSVRFWSRARPGESSKQELAFNSSGGGGGGDYSSSSMSSGGRQSVSSAAKAAADALLASRQRAAAQPSTMVAPTMPTIPSMPPGVGGGAPSRPPGNMGRAPPPGVGARPPGVGGYQQPPRNS
eukprot:SAG11_NODE_9050_length_949_cov_0.807059_1_plen_189_part_10